MAGLLSSAPPVKESAPADSGIDFGALNLKPPNAFAPNKFLNPDNPGAIEGAKATGDVIKNLALGIPKAFAEFALSTGEAAARIPAGLYGLTKLPGAGEASRFSTEALPPARIPGLGILGPMESIETRANKGQSLGQSAFDIATDEPLGLAFKPAIAGIGLLARGLKNGLPKELQSLAGEASKFKTGEEFAQSLSPETHSLLQSKGYKAEDFHAIATGKPIGSRLDTGKTPGQKTSLPREGLPNQSPESAPKQSPALPKNPASYSSDIKNLANEKVNVENFNISPEGKNIIEKTVEEVKPKIQEKVGTVLSNSEAIKQAENSSKILTRTIGRDQTLEYQGALLRARQALAASSKDGKVDESYIRNLLAVKTQGTDIARKLQSFAIGADAKDVTGKQAIVEAVLQAVGDADKVIKAADGVDFTNLKQATDFYRQFVKPTSAEWLDLLRYNSMLSSPKTHIINVFSNLLNTVLVAPIEKAITGGLDFLGSKVTGNPRQVFAGEAGPFLAGYFKNIREASQRFSGVMSGSRAFTNLDTKNIPIAASGTKGKVVSTLAFPMKMLEAADQFFTALTEGGVKGGLEYRAGKGVNVGNIESKAQDEAAYRLYRQDIFHENQGPVLDAVDQLTSKLQGLRNNPNPIVSTTAKFTVPFLRTPMNIFKQGLEYSPVGFGTIPGAGNKTEQLSKAILGSSVFAAASTLLMSNRLTFSEPTDPKQKQTFRTSGMQPYSVKVGDKWISYQKLPPAIAFPFAMVAAINETIKNKNIDDNTVDLVLSGVARYGQFLADQSYVKSIGDIVNAAKGGQSGIEQVISNYAQQTVPFRALGGWLARLFDHTQRKVDSSAPFIDQQVQLLMLNIPGLSQKVPARTDVSGKPIPQQSPIANAFSPVQFSTERQGGSAEFQKLMEIQQANKQTTADTKQTTNQVKGEVSKLSALSDAEEKKAYLKEIAANNPDLAKKVIAELKTQSKNLSASDQKLLNAPVATRARYIADQLFKLKTPEEKKALLKQLAAKKILTKATLDEVSRLMPNKQI